MIFRGFKFLAKKLSCASIFGAQGISMLKTSSFLLESAQGEVQDLSITVSDLLMGLLNVIIESVNSWVYVISKYILMFIDFCQVITYKIAGIDTDLEKIVDLPIFKLILNDTVLKVMGSIIVLSLVILVVAAIIAIVKSEYQASIEGKGDGKVSAYKVLGKSCISLFLMFITPFILVVAIIFSSVIMSSVNNVLNSNKTQQATIGGTIFMTSAYHANKYRIYASDGKRIPVLLNFDDPYEDGTYQYMSSEELHKLYEGWNGKEIYNNFAHNNFMSFKDSVTYKNGQLYNSNSYADYERFVATAEQYNVMADFIDYAMSHEIKFYIKDSNDKEIDWNRESSGIKISDGVYNPFTNSITITYTDVSDITPYADEYTITFETGTASADTPIETAVSTISLILGLNTLVSQASGKDVVSASSLINNSSLISSATVVEDLLNTISEEASSNSSLEFRLLERVEGSLNVVRWKTEKAFNSNVGKEYTVYELKKIIRNQQTGNNETRATIRVAKKDDSLDSKYYVLKELPNESGYYDYTNIEVDYYNDGNTYLDTLTPIFKKATWPEKLYNDLSVIYSQINFDNYINYDSWADELGTYFKTNTNVTSSEVATFATTLIHPLGLIMSELFLGLAIEGGNGETSSFSFTSAYLDDIVESLAISISNQYDYKNIIYQIDVFIDLFNKQFASVIESLKRIEGFDIYGTDELSVQGYVYKAYLASIMLSTDYGTYLYGIANTVEEADRLVQLMQMGSNSVIYDSNGNILYKIQTIKQEDGSDQPIYYDDPSTSKAVFDSKGNKVYVTNGMGILNANTVVSYIKSNKLDKVSTKSLELYNYFIPKPDVEYLIEVDDVAKTVIFDTLGASADVDEKFKEGNFNLSYYTVYSNKQGGYIPVFELFFGSYDAFLAEKFDNNGAVKTGKEDLEWFGDYFETYFGYYNDTGKLYVYTPIDGDTTPDFTPVKTNDIDVSLGSGKATVWKETVSNGGKNYYKISPGESKYVLSEESGGEAIIDEFINAINEKGYATLITNYVLTNLENTQIEEFDAGYHIYEVEKVIDVSQEYLTYDRLPKYYQELIDKIINKITFDASKGFYDEPFYLQFLREYKANSSDMKRVMKAEIIGKTTAEKYKRQYDEIVEDIDYCKDALASDITIFERIYYESKLNIQQDKLDKLKKYYIINGIESFASTQVTGDFTVVVNNHSYHVSQGMGRRELLETILGNKLTYTTLLARLDNNTSYADLGDFDRHGFDQLSAVVLHYKNELKRILGTNPSTSVLFGGKLTETEVELLETIYELRVGVYVQLDNQNINSLTASEKDHIWNELKVAMDSIVPIVENYRTGNIINNGITAGWDQDEAQAFLKSLIEFVLEDEQLHYYEDDYEGLIADDLTSFNLLREFLKNFGNLCFDLATKSNLGGIGKPDNYNLFDYIDEFMVVLNSQLENVDLGTSVELLTIVDDLGDILAKTEGEPVSIDSKNKLSELTNRSKEYFYILYEYFELKIANYEAELKTYEDAKEFASRYIKGRYAMQSNSYIYETGLKQYLNWFRYNVDILAESDLTKLDEPKLGFIDKYVYLGYDGYNGTSVGGDKIGGSSDDIFVLTTEERLHYYNLYLESFNDIFLGNEGRYFESLTLLQQKVIEDMADYFAQQYETFVSADNFSYVNDKNALELLRKFIFDDATFDYEFPESVILPTKPDYAPHEVVYNSIQSVVNNNLKVLNMFNLLDYVGIDFEVNKSLSEYRLDAINGLISFKERSGESGASIQARYLTLLYLACSDYTIDAMGNTTIQVSSATKNTILELAGLKDMPEEQLVGLEFEVTKDDTRSDEKYGSVFIICTYNNNTNLYEPFVFASGADSYGTPHTSFYSSNDGTIKYYPVIAKGVIGADGLPTAIREVNGYIEFYRETATIVDPGELNLELYYMSVEEVSVNYNPVNRIVNGLTKLLTGKTAAEHLIEAFPAIISNKDVKFCYGATTNCAWHLEGGAFELNYMFYNDSGIAMNCLYDASKLNGLILVAGCLMLAFALIKAMFGLIRNLYELTILIMLYPGVLALYPLTEDAHKNWRKQLIDRLLIMLSFVIAINSFFLILNLLQRMEISVTLSPESQSELKNTFIFGLFDVSGIIGNLTTLALFLVAAVLLKVLPDLFSNILQTGKGEVVTKGEKTQKIVRTHMAEASYFSSGYAIDDMVSSKMDAMRNLPLVGSESRAIAQEKRQLAQNKRALANYRDDLRRNGVSDDVADKAAEAYKKSLDRQIQAERERRVASREARLERISKHKKRIAASKESKKDVICPKCRAILKPKAKQCRHCGHKFKK